MSDITGMPNSVTRFALSASSRLSHLLVPAAILLALAVVALEALPALIALAAGLTLVAVAALVYILSQTHHSGLSKQWAALRIAYDGDPAMCIATDSDLNVQFVNQAARERVDRRAKGDVVFLRDVLDLSTATVEELAQQADGNGHAVRFCPVAEGQTQKLTVHRLNFGALIWRLEAAQTVAPDLGEANDGLAMLRIKKPQTIVDMNPAMEKLLGARPSTLDRVVARVPLRSGEPTTLHTADGPVTVHFAVVDHDDGSQSAFVWPEASPEVERANADSIPVPLMRLTPTGRVLMANARARKLLGLDEGQDVDFANVIEGLGRPIDEWLLDVSEGRGTARTEVVRAARSEQDLFLQVSLGRMVDRGEVSILVVLIDATELKTLEAQFVQSQKMQAIGQLAGGVAHDFNNLLTAISGHCDLLLLRHEPGDPNYGDLIQINQNANRAASLVGQLLAFSRKQNLRPELVDLRETLVDLTHLLNRLVGERIQLRWKHDPDLPSVRADKRQLEQVIMNLVVNARDAMEGGGLIHVETSTATLRDALLRDRAEVPPGDYVVVKVIDEGHGIPNDKLQKIFEPFYSTKKTGEGTGLGLSMAYGIVKQSGGFIFADSAVGKGSSFTMYFPAHHKAPVALEEPVGTLPASKVRQDGGNVLLVEDEAPVRAFASRALRLRGYTVTEAACAEDALDLLDDPELNVDVFVTDVVMPGMDGPTWVSKALESRPGVKVVFVSGYAEDSVSHNRSKIPNSAFLPKPFSLNQLTETVQMQLAS